MSGHPYCSLLARIQVLAFLVTHTERQPPAPLFRTERLLSHADSRMGGFQHNSEHDERKQSHIQSVPTQFSQQTNAFYFEKCVFRSS